jgi:hypothetical protein
MTNMARVQDGAVIESGKLQIALSSLLDDKTAHAQCIDQLTSAEDRFGGWICRRADITVTIRWANYLYFEAQRITSDIAPPRGIFAHGRFSFFFKDGRDTRRMMITDWAEAQ